MRNVVAVTLVSLLLSGTSFAAESQISGRKPTQISAQDLGSALQKLAKERGFQMVYVSEEISQRRTGGATGDLTSEEALSQLLSGTGLTYRFLGKTSVSIIPAAHEPAATAPSASLTNDERIHLSQSASTETSADAEPAKGASSNPGAAEAERLKIQEIIVTATKRSESIQDVPVSITAITAEDIARRGMVGAEDYLRGVPGVNQGSLLTGSSVIIRGLETSTNNQNFSSGPTVATYFGETPTTDSGGLSNNGAVDIKLVDIERIEVLRGPQGTAFGSSSLGGAVRTLPVAPKLDRLEGRVGAGYSLTSGTGSDNSMIQAVGNIPLIEDRLAIRAVAYRFEDSGFYRNVSNSNAAFRAGAAAFGAQTLAFAVDQDDIGASNFTGGRIAALLRASDRLQFTVSYLTQKTEIDGMPLTNLGDGYDQTGLQNPPELVTRGQSAGVSDTDIEISNLTLEYDLGWGNLLGTYSYVNSGSDVVRSYSIYGAGFLGPAPFAADSLSKHRQHVGELRLATRLDGAWNFLGGLYAEKLHDTTLYPYVWYGDPATSPFGPARYPGNLNDYYDERDLNQRAAFAEASWEFVPGLTLTAGGRFYKYAREAHVATQGLIFGNQVTTDEIEESGHNFRGNLSYKPNEAALVYGTWSQGFRLGKPQPGLPAGLCDINPSDGIVDGTNTSINATRNVASDTVDNYELGGKFTLLDRRLTISTAVFRIDWTGMPFLTGSPSPANGGCGLAYVTNAGAARSEGIESELSFRLSEAWRLDAGGSYTHARLTEDVPAQGLSKDDRLPGSPKLNANLGLQYAFDIHGREAFVRADSIYVGTFSNLLPYAARAEAGGYVKLDVSGGMAIGNLNVSLFARNLTGADDLVFREGQGDVGYRLRPRTVGLELNYNF